MCQALKMWKELPTTLRVPQMSNNNNTYILSCCFFSFGPQRQRVELLLFFFLFIAQYHHYPFKACPLTSFYPFLSPHSIIPCQFLSLSQISPTLMCLIYVHMRDVGMCLNKYESLFFNPLLNQFYFSITVDIHYYISFSCISQWLDIT